MSTPVFAHGQMRLYLLILLEESPKHGYELIQSIEQRFAGAYVPSAGTIYPRLAKLAEEGLVTKIERGRKTIYAITDAGRAEIRRHGEDKDQLEDDIDSSVRMLADTLRSDVHRSMSSLKDDLNSASGRTRSGRSDSPNGDSDKRRTGGTRGKRVAGDGASQNLQDAQRRLDRFDADMGNALRAAAASGTLKDDVVRILDDELTRVGDIVGAALSSKSSRASRR